MCYAHRGYKAWIRDSVKVSKHWEYSLKPLVSAEVSVLAMGF